MLYFLTEYQIIKYISVMLCQNVVRKQPFRGVLSKRCSKNMQQIYRVTTMPKCDFKNTSERLLLVVPQNKMK